MYNIMKAVIEARTFELKDALTKINTFWAQGSITEAQRAELIALAQESAKVENSIDVLKKLEELDQRMNAVEELLKKDESEAPEEVTYPEYVAGKWYRAGDVVMFNDAAYECIAPEGVVCVWNPEEYPTYWQAKTE